MNNSSSNEIRLVGQIVKVYPVKYTLQKIPVISFVIEHKSLQMECEQNFEAKCRMFCISLDNQALLNQDIADQLVSVNGFLSQNARSQLVLHIKKIEFLDKGN
ncbi:MAG: hypothetical protein ACK5Z5_03860 [Neisseriaceae bacterium]